MRRLVRLGRPERVGQKGGDDVSPPTRGVHKRGRLALFTRGRHRRLYGRHRQPRRHPATRVLLASSVVALLGLTGAVAFTDANSEGQRVVEAPGGRTLEKRVTLSETSPSSVQDGPVRIDQDVRLPENLVGEFDRSVSRLFRTGIDGVLASLSQREPSSVTSVADPDVRRRERSRRIAAAADLCR